MPKNTGTDESVKNAMINMLKQVKKMDILREML